MRYISLLCLFIAPAVAHAEIKSSESLAALMGAVSQVIEDNTKIPGKDESRTKLTPPAEQTLQALNNDLEDCQTSKMQTPKVVSVQKDGVSVEFKKYDLKIHGDNCPLEITVNLTATDESVDHLEAVFFLRVEFKKQTFIDKYKLRFIETHGSLSAIATKENNVIRIPVHLKMAANGDSLELGLFEQSVEMGVKIEMNPAQFSFSMMMEQTAILKYQDINQKGYSLVKMNGFSQPETLYTINDQNVSESEFQAFLQSFNMPSIISDEDPTSPDQKMPTQCSFVAYDKKAITTEALKTYMKSSPADQWPSKGQLAHGQSCMKETQIPFKTATQNYSGHILFGSEWISFNSVATSAPQFSGSVYVLYGDSAPQTSETEELILGLQCLPAPACHSLF